MATLVPVSTSDKIYDTISARVRQSYPNSCIVWIDKIENPVLEQAYMDRHAALCEKRGKHEVSEALLFHGTDEAAAHSIANNGYDVTYSKVAAYGKGTYFATTASYSLGYTKNNTNGLCFMLFNKVLIGSKTRCGSNQSIDTNHHDNSVDNIAQPSIVVCPYNDGALPTYIIAFYRNAK